MKIAITARNFSAPDRKAMDLLLDAGYEIIDCSTEKPGNSSDELEVIRKIGDADAAITGLEPFRRTTLEQCPNLKIISRRGIGYDTIDVDACRDMGICLARTAGAVEGAVAEHVMAYILWFSRHLEIQNASMHQGKWERVMMPGAKGRTLGLVGFGGIGKEIARRAVPFGMKILYYCRHPRPEWEKEYQAEYCDLGRLLSESDYVSANLPLTESTAGMFGEEKFRMMKKGSVFINISRGGIMDPDALKQALDSGHLRGAGIDVFDKEPCMDSPLASCRNAILTPHTAPYTSENFSDMNLKAAQNVLDFFHGKLEERCRVV